LVLFIAPGVFAWGWGFFREGEGRRGGEEEEGRWGENGYLYVMLHYLPLRVLSLKTYGSK